MDYTETLTNAYSDCHLCYRGCGVNRTAGELGYCRVGSELKIARAALHYWEEPCISGRRGSGAVFFSGCSLGCIYCQNREISRGESGLTVSDARLCEIMLELQRDGAHNINLVTPTHYAPTIIRAVADARARGLKLPIVYNTGSYDTKDTLEALRGTVDIFLPDLKYYRAESARALSFAEDLPSISREGIKKMVEIAGECRFDADGMLLGGVIVRILLLPGHLAEAKLNLKHLYDSYGDKIFISLMSQYTPGEGLPSPLNRRVTLAEYRELVDYALSLGVKNAYIQESGSAEESFIPPFDNTGVLP